MIKFKPLEEVMIDLEKSCQERNYKVFNSEYERGQRLLEEFKTSKQIKSILTQESIESIEHYYQTRLAYLVDRMKF